MQEPFWKPFCFLHRNYCYYKLPFITYKFISGIHFALFLIYKLQKLLNSLKNITIPLFRSHFVFFLYMEVTTHLLPTTFHNLRFVLRIHVLIFLIKKRHKFLKSPQNIQEFPYFGSHFVFLPNYTIIIYKKLQNICLPTMRKKSVFWEVILFSSNLL